VCVGVGVCVVCVCVCVSVCVGVYVCVGCVCVCVCVRSNYMFHVRTQYNIYCNPITGLDRPRGFQEFEALSR